MRKLTAYGPSIIVAATACMVLLAGPMAVQHLTYARTTARVQLASENLQQDNILEQINQAYRDIAVAVEPSVVHISAHRVLEEPTVRRTGTTAMSSGSGWIYDDRGHIVTNHHVVEDAGRIDVQLYTGEIRPAEIVGYDRSTDIAVLKIPSGRLHAAVRANPEKPVQQGELVFAFGSPFDFRFSMSSGVVSGQGRSVGVIRNELGQRSGYENFIQVDAAINPGNSGGPLTDVRGHVVGMNTAIATGPRRAYEEGRFAGIGLAIPMEMIEPVVNQLINTGEVRKGFMGVSILDRHMTIRHELAVMGYEGRGLLVARMEPDLAIAAGILRAGDVITRINGIQISSMEELLEVVNGRPGSDRSTFDVSLWRFDPQRNSGFRRSSAVPASFLRELPGISLLDLTEPISRRLEVQGFSSRGVVVPRLDPAGPAIQSGMLAGDVVTHVNGRQVGHVDQVRSMISSMMPNETAELRVWRYNPQRDAGSTHDIQVTLTQLDPLRVEGVLPREQSRDGIPELGIARMTTATQSLAEQYMAEFHPGVLIEELVPGTTLSRHAQQGAIIVRVMDRTITDVDDFIESLRFVDLVRTGARVGIINPDGSHVSVVLRVE